MDFILYQEIDILSNNIILEGDNNYRNNETRPGADCGSHHELLIAKFRLKLKKVGKITRPFRYDLTQIPYDYTVEVTDLRDIC